MKQIARRLGVALLLVLGAGAAQAQNVSLTGGTYSQNFDTLSNTAGSTTNTALPTGWQLTESGGGARDNEQYAVDTGSSNTGDTYSYGFAAGLEQRLQHHLGAAREVHPGLGRALQQLRQGAAVVRLQVVEDDGGDLVVAGDGFQALEEGLGEAFLHRVDDRHPLLAAHHVGVVAGALARTGSGPCFMTLSTVCTCSASTRRT